LGDNWKRLRGYKTNNPKKYKKTTRKENHRGIHDAAGCCPKDQTSWERAQKGRTGRFTPMSMERGGGEKREMGKNKKFIRKKGLRIWGKKGRARGREATQGTTLKKGEQPWGVEGNTAQQGKNCLKGKKEEEKKKKKKKKEKKKSQRVGRVKKNHQKKIQDKEGGVQQREKISWGAPNVHPSEEIYVGNHEKTSEDPKPQRRKKLIIDIRKSQVGLSLCDERKESKEKSTNPRKWVPQAERKTQFSGSTKKEIDGTR